LFFFGGRSRGASGIGRARRTKKYTAGQSPRTSSAVDDGECEKPARWVGGRATRPTRRHVRFGQWSVDGELVYETVRGVVLSYAGRWSRGADRGLFFTTARRAWFRAWPGISIFEGRVSISASRGTDLGGITAQPPDRAAGDEQVVDFLAVGTAQCRDGGKLKTSDVPDLGTHARLRCGLVSWLVGGKKKNAMYLGRRYAGKAVRWEPSAAVSPAKVGFHHLRPGGCLLRDRPRSTKKPDSLGPGRIFAAGAVSMACFWLRPSRTQAHRSLPGARRIPLWRSVFVSCRGQKTPEGRVCPLC